MSFSFLEHFYRFVQSSRSNGSRRLTKDSIRVVSEVSLITPEFHSWQNDYQPIYTRTKLLKPMTKDPYLQHKLRLTTAVESNATKEECFPKLISPSEVRISKPIIQRAPMPSIEIPEAKVKPIIVTTNITKNQSTTPVFATDARLLNRAKMQNQNLIIRRPPRKLMINITHETMLPLAVCG